MLCFLFGTLTATVFEPAAEAQSAALPGVPAQTAAAVSTGEAATLPAPREHHVGEGFRNRYPHENHGFGGVLRWRWDRLWQTDETEPPEGGWAFPMAEDDPARVQVGADAARITWVGHATLLLQLNGVNVLTDPTWADRASPLSWAGPKRIVPPALAFEHLPTIHAVIVSHNHYDHLNLETLHRLRARQPQAPPLVFAPLKVGAWLRENGVTEALDLDWWQHAEVPGMRATAVPVQHFSARTPFDRNETLWAGWVLDWPGFRFFFAGDTGYSRDFKDIAARFPGIDLAALPIGAYEPRWFMKAVHFNPADAVQALQDLDARQAIAMHWGTFLLTDEPPLEPPRALARALAAQRVDPDRFWVFQHGQTRDLAPLRRVQQAAHTPQASAR